MGENEINNIYDKSNLMTETSLKSTEIKIKLSEKTNFLRTQCYNSQIEIATNYTTLYIEIP